MEMNDKELLSEKNQNTYSRICNSEISRIILTTCELHIFTQIHSETNTAE